MTLNLEDEIVHIHFCNKCITDKKGESHIFMFSVRQNELLTGENYLL